LADETLNSRPQDIGGGEGDKESKEARMPPGRLADIRFTGGGWRLKEFRKKVGKRAIFR